MTPQQIMAVRCAYADLLGVLQVYQQGDVSNHDWKAHEETLDDLRTEFPDLNLEN